jgi:hypothetical protein
MKRHLKARATPAAIVGVLVLLTAGGAYALANGSGPVGACVAAGTRTLYKAPCHSGATPISLSSGEATPSISTAIPGGRLDSSNSSLVAKTATLPCFPKPGTAGVRFLSGGMTVGVTHYISSTCPAGQVNEFKVPRTGVYLVTASVVMYDGGGIFGARHLFIRDGNIGSDGGTELEAFSAADDGNATLSTSAVLHIAAGDVVFLVVSSTVGETLSGLGNTQFSIAWLGS